MKKIDLKKLKNSLCDLIAIILYRLHIPHGASQDIAENITLGYGKLYDYGFWQFQIPDRLYKHLIISFFWNYSSIYKSLFSVMILYSTPYKREIAPSGRWQEVPENGKFLFEFPRILRSEFKGESPKELINLEDGHFYETKSRGIVKVRKLPNSNSLYYKFTVDKWMNTDDTNIDECWTIFGKAYHDDCGYNIIKELISK